MRIRMLKTIVIAVAGILLAACWVSYEALGFGKSVDETAALASPSELQAGVVEAVFRYQMQSIEFEGRMNPKVFFLRLGRGEPSAQFLRRFAHSDSQVLPASASGLSLEGLWNPRIGVALHVYGLRRRSVDAYEVDGGYTTSPKSGESCTYIVRRAHGTWRVVNHIVKAMA